MDFVQDRDASDAFQAKRMSKCRTSVDYQLRLNLTAFAFNSILSEIEVSAKSLSLE